MRARKAAVTGPGDGKLRALLAHYQCPLPYHAVRTRLLGAIASPAIGISPIASIKQLWGGELPAFETPAAAETLFDALIGLWNTLTKHQQRQTPFRLSAIEVAATDAGLATLAKTRREELDGFLAGLFGPDDQIDFPEQAHQALAHLGEIRVMLAGIVRLAERSKASSSPHEIKALLGQLQDLKRIAEIEIHAALIACAQARQRGVTAQRSDR